MPQASDRQPRLKDHIGKEEMCAHNISLSTNHTQYVKVTYGNKGKKDYSTEFISTSQAVYWTVEMKLMSFFLQYSKRTPYFIVFTP